MILNNSTGILSQLFCIMDNRNTIFILVLPLSKPMGTRRIANPSFLALCAYLSISLRCIIFISGSTFVETIRINNAYCDLTWIRPRSLLLILCGKRFFWFEGLLTTPLYMDSSSFFHPVTGRKF
jgi:hypothetical protein